MFTLSPDNIHLSQQTQTKQQAIEQVAEALSTQGYVQPGYLQGMLDRENQTSTFLGNGIAIPHGTLNTRNQVLNTGVQVFQFPQGVDWGEGNIAYVVIGIAAKSNEHLELLRQLTHVLGDETTAHQLASLQDKTLFQQILLGEHSPKIMASECITLDIDSENVLTLQAINVGVLQQQKAINTQFVSHVLNQPPLALGAGIYLADSTVGNLRNAIAIARTQTPFQWEHRPIQTLVTVSAINEKIYPILDFLLQPKTADILNKGNQEQILAHFAGQDILLIQSANSLNETTTAWPQTKPEDSTPHVVGIFTVRNEQGLHARPSAVLVQQAKAFNADITLENLDRPSTLVNAKSLMKVIALGAVKGHRLRFVAKGQDALACIEAIQQVISQGLGESVESSDNPHDSIEIVHTETSLEKPTSSPVHTAVTPLATHAEQFEATFTIINEHGLHARPATVLVTEAKKYNAAITVENIDRDTSAVSAKSLMKVVALGAVKGHKLRFVASGEQAQQALQSIGNVIAQGLGE